MLLAAVTARVKQSPSEDAETAMAPLCFVPGSAVGQDGRSSALTAPNGPAQQAVITAVLEAAVLRPTDVASLQVGSSSVASVMALYVSFLLPCFSCNLYSTCSAYCRQLRPPRRDCIWPPSTPSIIALNECSCPSGRC